MDYFCIINNRSKDPEYVTSGEIKNYLEAHGKTCVITKDHVNGDATGNSFTDITEIPEQTQCVIVLGGDGTFIQAAIDLVHRKIPMLGVNMGTMGFLTEVEKGQLKEALDCLMEDNCKIEERMMITGSHQEDGNELQYAFNDIVITKSGQCRLISLELYVNGELIETYIADGLIISTPTGSTAYNLSAGGPVMSPGISAIIITPICPHSLNKRSMVISAEDELVVCLSQGKHYRMDTAEVLYDGNVGSNMKSGERIFIKRAEETTKVVKVTDRSFFGILREKFNQSGRMQGNP